MERWIRVDGPAFVGRRVRAHWWAAIPLLVLAWMFIRALLDTGQFGVSDDSALFYYSGRQWVQAGRVPYRHLWDVKPPLTHLTTALVALLTGGGSVRMHAVGVAINIGSIVGAITAAMYAVRQLTDSRLAGGMVGLSCLAFPKLFALTLIGFRPKYPMVLLLGLTLLAGVHRRWVTAAATATLGAGFWQPAGGVLAIVLASIAWFLYRGHITRRTVARVGIAVVGITTATVLPFVLGGALPEMIIQTVVVPLETGGNSATIGAVLGRTDPLLAVIATGGGLVLTVHDDHPARGWPLLFLTAFGLFYIGIDLDSGTDLLPLWLLVAVGVGIAIGIARPIDWPAGLLTDPRLWLVVVVGIVIWTAPGIRFPTVEAGHVADLFFDETIVPQCHIRFSAPERVVIVRRGRPMQASTCWQPAWWPCP